MATFQVNVPEKFDFGHPEEWAKWSRRFERFRQASGLETEDEIKQINTLIYAMGDEADDILKSFQLTATQKKKYDVIKERFENYFVVKRNVIFERVKFNRRIQAKGETVDTFVTALYCLAEYCGYGTLQDEMIRDRIVVGLKDVKLSERLQTDPDLTLQKAVQQARQSEAVKKQQTLIQTGKRGQEFNANVDAAYAGERNRSIKSYKCPKKHRWQASAKNPWPTKTTDTSKQRTCQRCEKTPNHSKERCPAREAVCHKCKKRGHYEAVCRSAKVIRLVEGEEDDLFLGEISTKKKANPWMTDPCVDGVEMQFKIDTGADVTIIPETMYRKQLVQLLNLQDLRKYSLDRDKIT